MNTQRTEGVDKVPLHEERTLFILRTEKLVVDEKDPKDIVQISVFHHGDTSILSTATRTMLLSCYHANNSGSFFFSSSFRLQNLDHVVLKCRNFDKTFSFYTDILGCTVDHPDDVGRFGGALTHLRAGTNTLLDLLSAIGYKPVDSRGSRKSLGTTTTKNVS
jgi:hypothetical protein